MRLWNVGNVIVIDFVVELELECDFWYNSVEKFVVIVEMDVVDDIGKLLMLCN